MKKNEEESVAVGEAEYVELPYARCMGCGARAPLPLLKPKGGGFPEPLPALANIRWFRAHREHTRKLDSTDLGSVTRTPFDPQKDVPTFDTVRLLSVRRARI